MRLSVLILTLGAFLAGYLMNVPSAPPEPLKLEGTGWCFYADYDSLDAYDLTNRPNNAMVNVHRKGVTVYVACKTATE